MDIAYLVRNKSFDAAAAIKNHFEATEHGIDRQCESCHGHTCSKSGHLQFAPKFLVVQLKRFMTKQLRQSVSHFKENVHRLSECPSELRALTCPSVSSASGANAEGTHGVALVLLT